MILGSLKSALDKLKDTGVRMTPQRHAILAYLYQTDGHPTADDIYKALAGNFPNMSVATVYNNLKVFRETGLVQELTFGDNSSRFEITKDIHYHVLCINCGNIENLEYPCVSDIEVLAQQRTGYKIDCHRVEVLGLCPSCQESL